MLKGNTDRPSHPFPAKVQTIPTSSLGKVLIRLSMSILGCAQSSHLPLEYNRMPHSKVSRVRCSLSAKRDKLMRCALFQSPCTGSLSGKRHVSEFHVAFEREK